MTVFHDLLRVQEHDTAADRLRHRRDHLPEATALRASDDELAAVQHALTDKEAHAGDAARLQRRLEGDLSLLEAKIADLDAKLYSGAVTVPRELQAIQAEAAGLRERLAGLEDELLEAMGEGEARDSEVDELRRRRDDLDVEGARLRATIAEAQAGIDRELVAEASARAAAAAVIPPDVSALYEQLRSQLGGIAAAPLVSGRCGGCHLTLPATELDRLRKEPPDALVRCEQCERILVRP